MQFSSFLKFSMRTDSLLISGNASGDTVGEQSVNTQAIDTQDVFADLLRYKTICKRKLY